MMRKTSIALTGLTGLIALLVAFGTMGATSPAHAAEDSCDGRAATIVVTPPATYPMSPVVGTPGDDVIVGTSGPDFIDGAGGNDIICGFGSTDRLIGGIGNDRLFGGLDADYEFDDGYFGDLLVPGPGDDHVDIGVDLDSLNLCDCDPVGTLDRISYQDATAGVDVDLSTGVATGEGRDTLIVGGAFGVLGSAFDDKIIGTEEMNVINAGAGADTVQGGGGVDYISADEDTGQNSTMGAKDIINAGAGSDYVSFTGGDRIRAGSGNDSLNGRSEVRGSVHGGAGRDQISVMGPEAMAVNGGGGNDRIAAAYTGKGTYALDGGTGRDTMFLRVRAVVPPGRIMVDLPKQRMSISGHKASVRLAGVESLSVRGLGKKRTHITFIGSDRPDSFMALNASLQSHGRGGNDKLYGSAGSDLLDGGAGRDLLNGGTGRDRCVNGEKVTQCEVRR